MSRVLKWNLSKGRGWPHTEVQLIWENKWKAGAVNFCPITCGCLKSGILEGGILTASCAKYTWGSVTLCKICCYTAVTLLDCYICCYTFVTLCKIFCYIAVQLCKIYVEVAALLCFTLQSALLLCQLTLKVKECEVCDGDCYTFVKLCKIFCYIAVQLCKIYAEVAGLLCFTLHSAVCSCANSH